nr:DUF6151 family protein [Sulfitobacter aestuariivivens]
MRCTCGKIEGHLTDFTPSMGTHAVCHCRSCRAGELQCGAPDPGEDGVHIFQISPHRLKITKGADHLAVFSFGPNNLLRWYASCCGAPLFTTPRNPRTAFVGVRATGFDSVDVVGPVAGHAFKLAKNGKTKHEGLMTFIWGAAQRIAMGRITGRWKQTPLFDAASGQPVATIEVLPKSRRSELLNA